MRPTGVRLLLPLIPVLLAACSGGEDVAAPATRPASDLRVVLERGDGSPQERWTLTCGGTGGDHPDGEAACAHLEGIDDPFAALPDDRICTEQYGGPQTARIPGRWKGEDVDLDVSRVDGCAIAQWDRLGPLLPQ